MQKLYYLLSFVVLIQTPTALPAQTLDLLKNDSPNICGPQLTTVEFNKGLLQQIIDIYPDSAKLEQLLSQSSLTDVAVLYGLFISAYDELAGLSSLPRKPDLPPV